jgi:uncharacterized iron-regulated membrane protein
MRSWLVRLHRWFGLAIALFLFVAGLTGAVIAWDHELDAALNPPFFVAKSSAPALSPLELANRIEAADPRVQVTYLPLAAEPGHTLQIGVSGRTNPATGTPYELGFNQLAVDPATGEIQARREWGAVSVSRLELIPFIYKLHYSLHLPIRGGIDLGMWLMGIVGIVWLFDSVIAIALAFPSIKSWHKSFMFRVRRGGYALTFDLHRSGGVWVWGLLMVVALTSIAMNLTNPVMRPLVSLFSPLGSTPFSDPALAMPPGPTALPLSRERVVALARVAARRDGIDAPPGGLLYSPLLNTYGVSYFEPGNDHGDAGLANAWLFWNAQTGEPVGAQIPGRGSAGDIFMQAQFPLHSGRIIGLTGRILVSITGVVVAMLSATGLLIWLKKARARRRSAAGSKVGGRRGTVA